ncbi:DUF3995 domain-containing protein [Paenibacillus allorhizosphaerae]|uniref:DUF3995 domain-containing protein n=1 Tax=Paenibacillus allorhizosphaerae TaxID=2849866 RepID=A0ABN7TUK9_9BACL|nr:DUF3995 domain-containing protein [Paenibacillus allorhizosphaerae]CAG7652767.1 hypothetical protein PAECIP111802_05330 [Paenibacillus allorhizosphaerae]
MSSKGEIMIPLTRSKSWIVYATSIWMIVFAAAHIYSALGGYYAVSSDPGTNNNDSIEVAADIIVTIMCLAGAFVSLAAVRSWGILVPRWIVLIPAWTGCILLVLRGGAGGIDQMMRVTGTLPHGFFGSSESVYVIWAGRFFDAYVIIGAILFVTTTRIYLRRTQR